MALETLLAGMPEDVELVSLQKDLRAEDPAVLAARGVMDVSQDLADMLDTAALIRALDIVVSVDTSVAHLAASLAVPTFIVLAFAPDWRWRLERTDSDWYRSVRLFRQSVPGDWTEALAAVRAAISAFAGRWRPDAD
jgi:hypothetical protein